MEFSTRPNGVFGFFSRYNHFAIIGHEEPDGDCLGSQLAMARFLVKQGKSATCYTPGPFVRPEIMKFVDRFSTGPIEGAEAAVIIDCSTLERIGGYADEIANLPTVVIDHHASGAPFGDVQYIDHTAPSVTYMILKLIEESGRGPDAEEAELLFFGLCTDTGFFRHVDANAAAVLSAASRLAASGASPKKTFAEMYGNRSFESRRLLGKLLARTEQRFEGRLLITWESEAELVEFGKLVRDSDTLFQQLQGVEGCEVVVLVRQEDSENCSVGLRSLHDIDVGKAAKHFGGGGHMRAAGFSRKGTAVDLVEEVVRHFAGIFVNERK